VGSALAPA